MSSRCLTPAILLEKSARVWMCPTYVQRTRLYEQDLAALKEGLLVRRSYSGTTFGQVT